MMKGNTTEGSMDGVFPPQTVVVFQEYLDATQHTLYDQSTEYYMCTSCFSFDSYGIESGYYG